MKQNSYKTARLHVIVNKHFTENVNNYFQKHIKPSLTSFFPYFSLKTRSSHLFFSTKPEVKLCREGHDAQCSYLVTRVLSILRKTETLGTRLAMLDNGWVKGSF